MITVEVTEADIRAGVAESCKNCPVAIATARATGEECMVYSRDHVLHLLVAHLNIEAPHSVRRFVRHFDDLGMMAEDESSVVPAVLPEDVQPFAFEIPDLKDPEWKDSCYRCEELFEASELDDEGYCKECLDKQAARERCTETTGPANQ